MKNIAYLMAERMGFEPMKELLLYTLSKRAPSTTRPPLHYKKFIIFDLNYIMKKINNCEDIFERNIVIEKVELNNNFPDYLLKNKNKYSEFII